MASGHPDLSCLAVSAASGLSSLFLKPLIGFLERSPARSPALDAAVAGAVLAIAVEGGPVVYFVGAVLGVQAAAAPSPPQAPWRVVALGVTLFSLLLVFIEVPLVAFVLYAADGQKASHAEPF